MTTNLRISGLTAILLSIPATHAQELKFVAGWGRQAGKSARLAGLAVAPSGAVYATDEVRDYVQKFSPDGAVLLRWGGTGSANGQFRGPAGIAADRAGNVYVADRGNHRIQKFSGEGAYLAQWGSFGSAEGQFNAPAALAIDTHRNVYVVDRGNHRIQKFSPRGEFVRQWGSYGFENGQFEDPVGIAADSSGKVYVLDRGRHEVQKFSSDGAFVAKWGGFGVGPGYFSHPAALATDVLDNVYIVEGGRGQKFSSDGAPRAEFGSFGSGEGRLNRPIAVAVSPSGTVFVADETNPGITEFALANPTCLPIQSVRNDQPDIAKKGSFALVANKDLVVRIFTNTGKGGAVMDGTALLCVDGKVASCDENKLFKAQGKVFESGHAFTAADRREAKNSLNIFITGRDADLLTAGEHSFDATVTVKDGAPPATCTVQTIFREGQQINLFVAPVTLAGAGPEVKLLPTAGDLVKSVYPVADQSVNVQTVMDEKWKFKKAQFELDEFKEMKRVFVDKLLKNDAALAKLYRQTTNNVILAVAGNAANGNMPFGTHDGVSILGFTLNRQDPPWVAATMDRLPQGDATIQRPGKITIASTAAHEIGHIFGFGDEYAKPSREENVNPSHSKDQDDEGTSAGYYLLEFLDDGFDVSGLRPKLLALDQGKAPPPSTPGAVFVVVDDSKTPPVPDKDPIAEGTIYGYMGGTGRSGVAKGLGKDLEGGENVRTWTRKLNYEFLYPKLTKPDGAAESPAPTLRQVIHLSGKVTQSGFVTPDLPLIAVTGLDFPPPAAGPYEMDFRDSLGQTLSAVNFDISFAGEYMLDGPDPLDEAPFDLVLDLPSGTASIVLLFQGRQLATFVRSNNTVTVNIVSASVSNDMLSAKWTASGPGVVSLQYIVSYLPNGVDRFVFATDIVDTSVAVSLTEYGLPAPQPGAMVCVQARDGFNSAEQCAVLQQ